MPFCFFGKFRSCRGSELFILLAVAVLMHIFHAVVSGAEPVDDALESVIIDEIQIEIILPEGQDADRWKEIAKSLIFLREGEPFSDERFSQTASALERSRLFRSIDIPDPVWTEPDSIIMRFRLQPFFRIKNIHISGGFPLLEREITDTMTVFTGDAYIPEQIDEQAQYIKDLFTGEGYINPEVTLTSERDPEDGHYILMVDIDKGAYYETDRVRSEGNDTFSGKRLLFRLNTWQASMFFGGASRYVQKDLEEDKEILRHFYWNQGFCEAQVDAEVKFNKDKTRARILFLIDEGPRYDVQITGNNAFWTRTLRNDLVIYEDGNINDFGMRRSIRNIETRYRDAGYPDVRIRRIDETHEENGQAVRSIELAIEEGPRYIVDKISISGNKNLSTKRIMNQMLTAPPGILYAGQYVPATLNEDIAAIRSLYRQRGYLSPLINSEVRTRAGDDDSIRLVNIEISLREGPQTIISDINIENMTVLDEEEIKEALTIEPGEPYREHRIQDSRTAIAAKISEKGHPHVKIDTEAVFSDDETAAILIFKVDEGPYTEMGKTFFTGNFLTRRRTLNRQSVLDEGEPFSLAEMLQSQRNIRNINALENARFQTIGLEEKADRITFLAEVNERKPYFYQFATGYDTSRLLYFNTGGGTINLLGRNKELRAFGELSMIGYKAEIVYTEPNLFNTRIVADAAIFTEDMEELNKNFGVRSSGASINLSRLLTPTVSASLGFLYDYRDQYRTDDTPIALEDQAQYRSRTVFVTTPGVTYNSTDSFVRPTRGIRASASVGVSTGLDNDLDNFLKYRLDTRYYYTPTRRVTLALLGQVGYIDPYGTQDAIPDDQLFFLGGTMNVRGFSENRLRMDEDRNPIGGRTSLMGSVEARYNFWRGFELALFYDTGTIRNTLRDEGSNEWRSSLGLGLRYHTAIGPIGLMYGWKLDRKEGESPGAYHFSIGYTF